MTHNEELERELLRTKEDLGGVSDVVKGNMTHDEEMRQPQKYTKEEDSRRQAMVQQESHNEELERVVAKIAENESLLKAKDIDTEKYPFLAKLTFDEYKEFRTVLTSYANSRIQEFVREVEGMKKPEFIGDLFEAMGLPSAQKSVEDFLQIDKVRSYNQAITDIVSRSQKYISKEKE